MTAVTGLRLALDREAWSVVPRPGTGLNRREFAAWVVSVEAKVRARGGSPKAARRVCTHPDLRADLPPSVTRLIFVPRGEAALGVADLRVSEPTEGWRDELLDAAVRPAGLVSASVQDASELAGLENALVVDRYEEAPGGLVLGGVLAAGVRDGALVALRASSMDVATFAQLRSAALELLVTAR